MTQLLTILISKNYCRDILSEGIQFQMNRKGMKQLATNEIWPKQNGMTYGLHDNELIFG